MQNNMPQSELPEKQPFQPFVETALAEGITGGIVGFIQKNNVNLTPEPGAKVEKPFEHFVGLIMSEYLPVSVDYPLESSLRATVDGLLHQEKMILQALYANNEMDNLRGLCRVIGGTAVVETLEGEREKVLKLILGLRGL